MHIGITLDGDTAVVEHDGRTTRARSGSMLAKEARELILTARLEAACQGDDGVQLMAPVVPIAPEVPPVAEVKLLDANHVEVYLRKGATLPAEYAGWVGQQSDWDAESGEERMFLERPKPAPPAPPSQHEGGTDEAEYRPRHENGGFFGQEKECLDALDTDGCGDVYGPGADHSTRRCEQCGGSAPTAPAEEPLAVAVPERLEWIETALIRRCSIGADDVRWLCRELRVALGADVARAAR